VECLVECLVEWAAWVVWAEWECNPSPHFLKNLKGHLYDGLFFIN
jgi:hypothetical protein